MRLSSLFFFTDRPPTASYPLSLHDALPISAMQEANGRPLRRPLDEPADAPRRCARAGKHRLDAAGALSANGEAELVVVAARQRRSEEHTSELQSRENLVCRLLLEKKKETKI